jgi:predicted aconitase with swiveling domain
MPSGIRRGHVLVYPIGRNSCQGFYILVHDVPGT